MLSKVFGISFLGNVYKNKKQIAKEVARVNPDLQDGLINNLNNLNDALGRSDDNNFYEIRLKQNKYFLKDAQKPSQYAHLEVKRLDDKRKYTSGFYLEKHGSEERIISKDNLEEIFYTIQQAVLNDCRNSSTARKRVYYSEEKTASELAKIEDRETASAIKDKLDDFCDNLECNLDEDCIIGVDFSYNKDLRKEGEGRIDIYIPGRAKNKHLWSIFPISQDAAASFSYLKSRLSATTEGINHSDEYKLRELKKEGEYEAMEIFNKLN